MIPVAYFCNVFRLFEPFFALAQGQFRLPDAGNIEASPPELDYLVGSICNRPVIDGNVFDFIIDKNPYNSIAGGIVGNTFKKSMNDYFLICLNEQIFKLF